MLTNYFTQKRLDFLMDGWWLRYKPSGVQLAGGEKAADDDLYKFSAFVSAFLDLLLSVLLFLGAVVACLTSQFVKFFRLESPCTYIGCTRLHLPLQSERRPYCSRINGGFCHNCFLLNNYAKFGLEQYVLTGSYTNDASSLRSPEASATPYCLRDRTSRLKMREEEHADDGGGFIEQRTSNFDGKYFVCSNCDERLCGRTYRRRHVKRKILHDMPQQVHWNALDDTAGNVEGKSSELHDRTSDMQHSVHRSILDADNSQAFSDTSAQEEESTTTSDLPGNLDVTDVIDCLSIEENDARENVEENSMNDDQISTELDALRDVKRPGDQVDEDQELCRWMNGDKISFVLPDPLGGNSAVTFSDKTMGIDIPQHMLEGIQREASSGTVYTDNNGEGASVASEGYESIREDEDRSAHVKFLSEDEEKANFRIYDAIAKQEESLQRQENNFSGDSHCVGDEKIRQDYTVDITKQDENLEETKSRGYVELCEASSSREKSLAKGGERSEVDLLRDSEQKESTIPKFVLTPVVVTDSIEDKSREVTREIPQHVTEEERTSEEIREGGEIKDDESKDVSKTQVTITDFAESFHCKMCFDDEASETFIDCLLHRVIVPLPQLQDTQQLEGNIILTQGVTGEFQQEFRGSVIHQSIESKVTQDDYYLREGSNEISEVTQIEDIGKAVETVREFVAFKEQQEGSLSAALGLSKNDVEENCETRKLVSKPASSEQNQQEQTSQDFSIEISIHGLSEIEQQKEVVGRRDAIEMGKGISLEDPSSEVQQENGFDNLKETEFEDEVGGLREALEAERHALSVLYAELEEERKAAATAATEAMAMISRLQEEKAAMQMEAAQYQRMVEEKAIYDQQALTFLKEIILKREKEKYVLEKEVELYRGRRLKKKVEELTNTRMGRGNDVSIRENREPVLLLEGIEEEDGLPSQQLSDGKHIEMDSSVVYPERKTMNTEEHNSDLNTLPSDENEVKRGVDSSNTEDATSAVISFIQADEKNNMMRQWSEGVLPRTHSLDHMEAAIFSTENEDTRSILERLWFLEVQLKELRESTGLDCWKAGSDFQQISEELHQSPETCATWKRVVPTREYTNGLWGAYEKETTDDSSPRTPGTLRRKAEDDSLAPGFQRASEYSHELTNAWNIQMKEASPFPCQREEAHLHRDGVLPVHDIYEVQHGLKPLKRNSFGEEGEEYHEQTDDRLGKPESSPGNISQESSHSTEFVRKQLPRHGKGRNLFSPHGMTSSRPKKKVNLDTGNNEDTPRYPTDEWSLGPVQEDFCNSSMIIKDKNQMITEKEVQGLTARLQLLESDRDFLQQMLTSLKHKDSGINLLQEIVQHLRELKATDNKTLDIEYCSEQLQPLFNSSAEIHTPVVKKRRHTSEPAQTKCSALPYA